MKMTPPDNWQSDSDLHRWFRPKATGVSHGNMTKNFISVETKSKDYFAESNGSDEYLENPSPVAPVRQDAFAPLKYFRFAP
jgi:hypothetical protein